MYVEIAFAFAPLTWSGRGQLFIYNRRARTCPAPAPAWELPVDHVQITGTDPFGTLRTYGERVLPSLRDEAAV
jgi:hypothetical protein